MISLFQEVVATKKIIRIHTYILEELYYNIQPRVIVRSYPNLLLGRRTDSLYYDNVKNVIKK
jgi:hypothetical protein